MVKSRSPKAGCPPTAAISGVTRSLTSAVTTAPNAAPTTTAMARSTRLPRNRNCRKSLSIGGPYWRADSLRSPPMDLSIFFAGPAGSVPTARRGLPATLVRRGADKLLVDCGEGHPRQLIRSVGLPDSAEEFLTHLHAAPSVGLPDITEVFLTHLHVDHWLGLPGMLKSFDLRDRSAPLTVFGPPGTEGLRDAMRRTVFGRLKYRFRAVDLEPDAIVEFDGYEVHALRVRHRGEAYGCALIEEERP